MYPSAGGRIRPGQGTLDPQQHVSSMLLLGSPIFGLRRCDTASCSVASPFAETLSAKSTTEAVGSRYVDAGDPAPLVQSELDVRGPNPAYQEAQPPIARDGS